MARLIPVQVPIPAKEPKDRLDSFEEYVLPYTREAAIEEAQRCVQCAKPWCNLACPIEQDARLYIKQIADGNFEGAVETILKDDMMASCLGKVCYSYCEDVCVVAKKGDPVAIRHLKWAALEYGNSKRQYVQAGDHDERIAVIGAGPSGLAAARVLGQRGYHVTVFEASPRGGGLVTGTIPIYRLAPSTFEEDLRRMESLPIDIRYGVQVGTDITLEELETEYDAVFVGVGTHKPGLLNVPGSDLEGVDIALHFLKGVMEGERPFVGDTVAIIGAGDVAIDCSRTVLRLGAKRSVILYRRTREEMPAADEEVEGALEEGVELQFLVSPVEFRGHKRVQEAICQVMELGEPDASGRRRPVPVEGKFETIPVDTVLLAIGQKADLENFPDLGVEIARDGSIVADPDTGATSRPGVFAGGGQSIVHAMASGERAALGIMKYLGEEFEPGSVVPHH